MKRVVTAVVLIPLVLLLIFKAPFWLLTLVVTIVAELALWEYLGLADATGAKTPRIAAVIATALIFLFVFFRPEFLIAGTLLSAVTLAVLVICAFKSPVKRVLPDTAFTIFGILYVGMTLSTLLLLYQQENGPSLLLFLFLVVWSGDIAALYVGRTWGKRKLAPALSPGKTWEGSIASMAGSVLVAFLLILLAAALSRRSIEALSYPGSAFRWLILGAVLNIAAQVGDLVESAIKRGAGVKDSGTLLPGHGGILDRIDALLLASPVLWYAVLAQQQTF